MMSWSLLVGAAPLFAPPLHAQSQPASDSSRAAAFDRLDRTSRTLLSTVNCARMSAQARAKGLFGPLDSVGRRGLCLRMRERAFGVFFTPDSTFTTARNFRVVELANELRFTGSVDTSAMLAEARAMSDALDKGFPAFVREKRQFAPLSFRSDGDSIEVWLVPAGSLIGRTPSTVGGERGFVYSPDGKTLGREINAFDRFRTISIPDSGQVRIVSQEEDLPLVSELIATNLVHGQGREVQIVTKTYTSQLVGSEPNSVWIQLRKR